MKCVACQSENSERRKFCRKCGERLALVCTACGTPNLPDDCFCGECGQAITPTAAKPQKAISFDEKLRKTQKYLPDGLTQKILAERGKIEGERRQVTVLFADMENFTPLVEKLGPEEAYAVMDQVYDILLHRVHHFGGTVNEMTGDGVMALFGAPIALEDAPQRAIRSSLAVHQEIARFSDRMKNKENALSVKMRIGIHTGPVIVGTLGNDLKIEFKAVGDTVNLASRIQAMARAGTTCVSPEIFKLTEGLFRFEALGEKNIKGKQTPVCIYQVIAPSSRRTRFDVNAERGLTPFVGRVRELENLMDGLERAKAGRGQVFSLIGEAGVGKSRLLYEFRKIVSSEDIVFLEGKCLSYGRNAAYHPIIDILKSTFGILEGDADCRIREKLVTGLRTLGIDTACAHPYLFDLLSVKDSGIEKVPMSPKGKRDRLIKIMKKIVLRASEPRPLIMAIEDLHWVDKSTEDVLQDFIETIPGARILMIFTYRPEFTQSWRRKSYHNQLTLNRLSNRESLLMAASLLGIVSMDKDMEDLILSRTEGIPFFIEEFIKSFKDLHIIDKQNGAYKMTKDVENIKIPSTIHDVIMARVDALPEGAKEILRSGSVIEREFSHELLKKITDLPEGELLSHLSMLKDAELIYERGIYPHSTYIFKHALTQEVVCDSILKRKKKQLHEKIVLAMEEIYKEDISDFYGILAGHCLAGEQYEKGAKYSRLEAKRYQKAGLLKDAIEYAKMWVTSCEMLPQTEDGQKKLIDARTKLANYYLSINFFRHAKETVEPVFHLASDLNYLKKLPAIYMSMGLYSLAVEEDSRQALDYIDQARKMAEDVSDRFSWWTAVYQSGTFIPNLSEFDKSRDRLRQCLDYGLSVKNPMGIAFSKGALSYCDQIEGEINSAYQMAREALALANETGDAFIKGMACSIYGVSCYQKGLFDHAKTHFLEFTSSYEKSAPIAFLAWGYGILGSMHIDFGEYDEAVSSFKKVIAIMEGVDFLPSIIRLYQSCLARAKVLRHDGDIELSDLFAACRKNKILFCEGWMDRNIGDILLNTDACNLSDAEEWFKKAINADGRNGFRWQLAADHAAYANWFTRKSNKQGAKEQLASAIDIFRKCGADGWVERYEREIALL